VIDDGDRTNYLTGWSLPQVLLEYDEQGNILKDYAFGDGLIRSRTGGTEVFYHMDGLGSTRLLTNADGTVSDRYNYDAYGVLLTHAGTNNNSFLFAGEQRDSSTGLDYLRARYYDPDLGRFISKDPFSGFITDPMSQHDYQYAHANPVRFTDPTGYFSMTELGAGMAIGSILASMTYAGYSFIQEGADFEELPNMADQWVAGFAHVVSFGATTYIRNKYIGGIATEHHSGFFWNMGMLAGLGTSLMFGAQAPGALSFSMGFDEWLVVGYEVAGTAVSAWQTGTNISNGRLGWTDTFTLLPLVTVGLSSEGTKKFLTGAKAMSNGLLRDWGKMFVHASNLTDTPVNTPLGGRGFNPIDPNSPMSQFGSHSGTSSGRPFSPDEVGLPISSKPLSTDGVVITNQGVDKVEQHLARFGSDPQNEAQLRRLRDIASGVLKATQADLNNYTHELREYLRYKRLGYQTGVPSNPDEANRLWNNAHTATLEEYNLKEGFGILYHSSTY
jgi:RHS repeat-associated protein